MAPPIHADPDVLRGTPCFTGTRVPVQALFNYLKRNHPIDEFLADFPTVEREQVIAVLDQAPKSLVRDAAA